MTADQLFSAIGEIDSSLIAAASHPPRRHRVIYGWMLAAAAAVVIGVVGYAGILRAWQDTPSVQPPTPPTAGAPVVAVTTTTEEMTQEPPSSVLSPETGTSFETGESTTDTSAVIPSGPSVTSTTTKPPTTSTTPPPTSTTTVTSTATPPVTGDPTSTTTTARPTDPGYSGTTTVSSTTPGTATTVAPTEGTAPDGRPLLNSDGDVVSDHAGDFHDFVYAYSFEELQVKSIVTAPSLLPVYVVTDSVYERTSPTALVNFYASLVGDTLTVPPSQFGNDCSAEGERFSYILSVGEINYIMLWLTDPIALGDPADWMDEAIAYCPELFADMAEPALYLSEGGRRWTGRVGYTPAKVEESMTFDAQIYDAANDPDGTAKWLNGVSLKVEDGKLKAFFIMLEENYRSLGSYPILTVEEATALAHKQCATWKDYQYYDVINEDYEIMSVELMYLPHSGSSLRVPLYRFLVTADETNYNYQLRVETGLTIYRVIWVTAIPPEYWTEGSRDIFITQE